MISESHVAYGSSIPRHGNTRAWSRYHGINRCRKSAASSSTGASPITGFKAGAEGSLFALSFFCFGESVLAIFILPISSLAFCQPIHRLCHAFRSRFIALGLGNPRNVLTPMARGEGVERLQRS